MPTITEDLRARLLEKMNTGVQEAPVEVAAPVKKPKKAKKALVQDDIIPSDIGITTPVKKKRVRKPKTE